MDLTAACSGFVLGVVTAAQFIRTGTRQNVLVVGADALSRYVDWNDRGVCHPVSLFTADTDVSRYPGQAVSQKVRQLTVDPGYRSAVSVNKQDCRPRIGWAILDPTDCLTGY